MLIRPSTPTDLPALMKLALGAGKGLTTLPADEALLTRRLALSEASFTAKVPPPDAFYLFALEIDSQVVGVSGLAAGVGLSDVFYNYRLSRQVNASQELGIHITTPTLQLSNDMTGLTELCSLLLDTDSRGNGAGVFLSRCRLMFLAAFSDLFSAKVFAEMRGVSDQQGRSPLWESLGRLFFDMPFAEADQRSMTEGKAFIAELMPKYPIYLPLLPAEAQEVVGKVHPDTRPALALLEAEGFNYNGMVDIFDGGPLVEAFCHNIRSIRQYRHAPVRVVDHQHMVTDDRDTALLMVSNRKRSDFRVILVAGSALDHSGLTLTVGQARQLLVEPGDEIGFSPLKDTESQASPKA